MNDFRFFAPTEVVFGRDAEDRTGQLAARYGSRALLVYGGGSIRKNGIYDEAVRVLTDAGLTVLSMGGVEPNPRVGTVRKGIEFCRQDQPHL